MWRDIIRQFKTEQILAVFIGLSFLVGVLNFPDLIPSKRKLHIGLQVSIVLSIGLFFVYSQKGFVIKKIGYTSLIWFSLIVLLLLQPLLNHISYPDSLIFPIGSVILIAFTGVTVYQINDKIKFIKILASFILLGAVLEAFSHLVQLFHISSLYDILVMPITDTARAVSNVGQPNQAAFIYAMGITSACYLFEITSDSNHKYTLPLKIGLFLSVMLLYVCIAVTSSRGGIILGLVAIFGYYLLSKNTLQLKFKKISFLIALAILSFIFGIWLAQNFSQTQSVVDRIASTSQSLRLLQQEQALLIFSEHPITGIGWGNFSSSVYPNFEKLNWVSLTDHSHFIFTQLASELGILGLFILLPFIYVVLKNLKFNVPSEKAYCLAILSLIFLYSMSEFPLWYFVYLLIFAVFLALIDIEFKLVTLSGVPVINRVVQFVLIIVMLLCGYYHSTFMKYAKTAYISAYNNEVSDETKLKWVNELPLSFGFTKYKEKLLYTYLPVSNDKLQQRIELGDRVTMTAPEPELMMKHGLHYALAGDQTTALNMFKYACLYSFATSCDYAENKLKQAYQSQPSYFETTMNDFTIWRTSNPVKTKLKK